MQRFFKTNDALGHNEYAYVLKLTETEYLCCYYPSFSYSYEEGVVADYSDYNLEPVSRDEFKKFSNISSSLIDYLLREKP
ncbi:hypothetical protein XaC1_502 [Xanthomonas phage XaC1]|nr:hypothetical protein XaC1_502 [Xanthomonas phage XaC1]